MSQNQLHLICHPSWMRDELAANTKYEVEHSFGLDVPEFQKKDIWWLPQAQAVQLLNSIQAHQITPVPAFTAPSGGLLAQLDKLFVGRATGLLAAHEAVSVLVEWPTQFWKLATAKSDKFEAKVRTHEELIFDIEAAELPAESLLEYSEVLDGAKRIIKEYRLYVSDEEIQTGSLYLDFSDESNPVTIYDGAVSDTEELAAAIQFGEAVVTAPHSPDMPPAYVMDVALLDNGGWIVLEFNPVWCSAWYDADVDAVVATIARGFMVSASEKKKWAYQPDPLLLSKYKQIWPKK